MWNLPTTKGLTPTTGRLLQPLLIPNQVWDEITMDFIKAPTKVGGCDTVLVMVNRLTKYPHFIGLQNPFAPKSVASVFIREVVRLHGFPSLIVSDRDKIFVSNFWKEMFRPQGTTLLCSMAYHPQTDGQSEIVNQALETYMRCFVNGKPKQWVKWLHWAKFCYNTSPHLFTKMTHFRALYGGDPPSIIHYKHSEITVDSR